jgi:hypothetical protein
LAAKLALGKLGEFFGDYISAKMHFRYHVGPFGKQYCFNKNCEYCRQS